MSRHRHDSVATQRDLIEAARSLFSEVGYGAARTEEIVARTGLTRGALYHHFDNKEGLFVAVLEEVHTQLAAEVNRRAVEAQGGAAEAVRAGFHAWLDVALQDNVRQILLVDGPAVLGWDRWHEMDRKHGFGATRNALRRAMNDGEIAQAPADELTHVLLGAVTQAGLELGRSSNTEVSPDAFHQVIDLLIDKLRI